jgi:AcrR family transcriptional regulator
MLPLTSQRADTRQAGYVGLTMEAVADRAGISRAVLYRRWRNRPELVIAAMRRHRPMLSGEVPDTGTLRGDVLAVLRRVSAQLAERGTGHHGDRRRNLSPPRPTVNRRRRHGKRPGRKSLRNLINWP